MFKTGLTSISFRKLSASEIIAHFSKTELDAIEWGSDIHAPWNDPSATKVVAALSATHDISTPTYGSYYKLGVSEPSELPRILEAAKLLGASTVRIWGCNKAVTRSEPEWERIVSDAKRACLCASEMDITLALECHNKTITEDYRVALDFLSDVDSDNLKMYWQPNHLRSFDYNLEAARALSRHVVCVHVFNWDSVGRYPLAEAAPVWRSYLDVFALEARTRDIPLLLEFMPDGDIGSLFNEAKALSDIASCYAYK